MIRRFLLTASLLSAIGLAARGSAVEISPRDLWPQVTAAADTGDLVDADKRLTDLIETGKQLGIRRFPLYAESAAALARSANREGPAKAPLVKWAMNAAMRLDPDSPAVAFARADLAKDQARWGAVIPALASGFSKIPQDPTVLAIARADLFMVLFTTIFVAVFAYALLLFFRYNRSASHDFREMLSGKARPGVVSVLAYSLLFAPLFLWLGPTWLMLYWFLIFFGYATVSERVLTGIATLLLALIVPLTQWNANSLVRNDSPAVRAAAAAIDDAYHPESVRRVRDMVKLFPTDARLHLLLGNLEFQDGNEGEAGIHYRRATELNQGVAGAHLNIGNLHFIHQDFQAAISQYTKAAEIDPGMAIAYFNHAAASGETYKYDEQKQKIGEAKARDRALTERLLAKPGDLKVAFYDVPMADAWSISDAVSQKPAAQELFASYGSFDIAKSIVNPLTIGSLLALLGGILLWKVRRDRGFAGACMKCGRTFCIRCKSAKESATYCTQCIHIYLKRDGVSLDTKRLKLDEVQAYQSSRVRLKKLFATFLPGSGQILEGSTFPGFISLLIFLFLVLTALAIGRLAPVATPAEMMRLSVRTVSIAFAVLMWIFISIPIYRHRPVSG